MWVNHEEADSLCDITNSEWMWYYWYGSSSVWLLHECNLCECWEESVFHRQTDRQTIIHAWIRCCNGHPLDWSHLFLDRSSHEALPYGVSLTVTFLSSSSLSFHPSPPARSFCLAFADFFFDSISRAHSCTCGDMHIAQLALLPLRFQGQICEWAKALPVWHLFSASYFFLSLFWALFSLSFRIIDQYSNQ